MRVRAAFLLALLTASIVGCSPFQSGGDLFASGRDARVFNAATGRYDWPDEPRERAPRNRPAAERSTSAATPAPSDGRVYNLEKGRYEWSDSGTPKNSPFEETR